MKSEKIVFNSSLDFISSYHSRVKQECERIKTELPYSKENPKPKKGLHFVEFKDIGESWSVSDLLRGADFYESKNLILLANKIERMFLSGNAEGVKRMIESFFTTGVKKQSQPPPRYAVEQKLHNRFADFLGYGHFREGHRSVKLTEFELEKVREFFNINIGGNKN